MADKTPTLKQDLHQKEVVKQRKIRKAMFEEAQEFRKQFAERALKLVTSGFGLVSALAWNELIKEIIKVYIKPLFGESSGLISLLIYALIVTALAVFITYQLSKFGEKKEG
jgi:hypothetical protein